MLGVGTKTVITIGRDFKALIDVSRLVSRVGYGPHTGVDRVELAYLEWCLSTDADVSGLARVRGGVCLLDRRGLGELYAKIKGTKPWGRLDIRGFFGFRTPNPRARAESDVRRLAIATSEKPFFHSIDLSDYVYLNTGHSNLSHKTLGYISSQVASVVVFLHDVIPLEYPEFQTPESVLAFKQKIRAVEEFADAVLFNSEDTRKRSGPFLSLTKKQNIVAHLGIDTPAKYDDFGQSRPYFVVIGTIEPRKNHKLLLDVWTDLQSQLRQDQIPHLYIVGRRGWENEAVFAQLDKATVQGHVTEHSDLSDVDMWALLQGAEALLFPSFAEGFGLPSLEAAALGVPVICGDLAIHRELLGDYPVYVDLQDAYLWKKTILEQTQATHRSPRPSPQIPTWDEHFARVNQAITEKR